MPHATTDAIAKLVNTLIVSLPFVGYAFFGEGFELAALAYLAIIAFHLDPHT